MATEGFVRHALLVASFIVATAHAGQPPVNDPTRTSYGEISPNAAPELRAFSFLIGKWDGKGKTKVQNDKVAGYPVKVNAGAGAVKLDGRNVTIVSDGPGIKVRELYIVPDDDHFTYRLDLSSDGGKTWNTSQVEMTFTRVE